MAFVDLGGHSVAALTFVAIAAIIAGLARGFSGFGAALIFIPLASTAIGPTTAAALLLIVDIVMASPLLPRAWGVADRRNVGTMLIGTILGVPAGTLVLTQADPIAIRWMIAGLVAAMLALLMSGWRYHGRPAALSASDWWPASSRALRRSAARPWWRTGWAPRKSPTSCAPTSSFTSRHRHSSLA